MPIREIVTIEDDNPILRRRARLVRRVTPAIQELMDDMVETMRDAPGVGLAAPQVNVPLRVIVVEVPIDFEDLDAGTWLYTLANPEIVKAIKEQEEGEEGCLSIPELHGYVDRAIGVTVQALNRDGKKIRIKATGFLARVLQHEVDHLNGILFTDHVSDPDKLFVPEDDDENDEAKPVPIA